MHAQLYAGQRPYDATGMPDERVPKAAPLVADAAMTASRSCQNNTVIQLLPVPCHACILLLAGVIDMDCNITFEIES